MKSKLLPPLWLITCSVLALVCFLAYELKDLMKLLIIGFVVAYTLEPLVFGLEKLGIRRQLGIILITILLILALVAALATAVPVVAEDFNALVSNFPRYIAQAKEKLETFAVDYPRLKLHTAIDKITNMTESLVSQIVPFLTGFITGSYSLGLTLVNLALLPFIVYYLVVDFKNLKSEALNLLPVSKRNKVSFVISEINFYVSSFVRGQIIVCICLFVMYAICLGGMGLELWLLLALISGFGHLVPYMGFVVGISLSSLIALVQYTSLFEVILVWIIYSAVQFVEGSILSPKIIGDKTGLSPLAVILSLVAGGTLFGLLGIVLAIPILTSLKVISKYVHSWLITNIESGEV